MVCLIIIIKQDFFSLITFSFETKIKFELIGIIIGLANLII